MTQVFKGRTEDAEAPFLTADFWREGVVIRGAVEKLFNTKLNNMPCYVLNLEDPIEVGGESQDRVSVGNMAGFQMAMQAAGVTQLRAKDIIELECTGVKKSKKEGYSDRVNFDLKVTRP